MDRRTRTLWSLVAVAAFLAALAGDAGAAPIRPPDPDYGWLMDDGSGTNASAWQGGADGALQNGATWTPDTPFAYAGNNSIQLDGADAVIEVAALNGALNGATAFTLSLWIRSDAVSQDRAFFGGTNPSSADTWGGRYDSAGWLNGNNGTTELIKFGLMIDGTNYQYESAGGYQSTAWQHVVFTWESGAGPRLYVDGVLDTASAISTGYASVTGALSDQTRFLIGDGAKANWDGAIDEVMVWRSALGVDQIDYLAASSMAPAFVPEPSIGLLWLGALASLGVVRARASRPSPDARL